MSTDPTCYMTSGYNDCKYNFTLGYPLQVNKDSINDRGNAVANHAKYVQDAFGNITRSSETWGDWRATNLTCSEDWNLANANSGCPQGYSGEPSTTETRSIVGAGTYQCSRSICSQDISLPIVPNRTNCCLNITQDQATADNGCNDNPSDPNGQWYKNYALPTTACNATYEQYCSTGDNVLDPNGECFSKWCTSSPDATTKCNALMSKLCVGDTMLTNKACETFCALEGTSGQTINCDVSRRDACTNLGMAGAIESGTKCGCYLDDLKNKNGLNVYGQLFQDLQDRLNGLPADVSQQCFYRDCVTAPRDYKPATLTNIQCPSLCIQSVTINDDGTINGNVVINQQMEGCSGYKIKKCVEGKIPSADGSQCVDPETMSAKCPASMIPTADKTGCIYPTAPQDVKCRVGWKPNATRTGCVKASPRAKKRVRINEFILLLVLFSIVALIVFNIVKTKQ